MEDLQIKKVRLSTIQESAANPRRTFEQAAIDELAESIKSIGVIQPIVVRPVGKKMEIVCGARRYRASVQAGENTIPALIRNMNDQEAFEMAITENLQRQDVHPLDEAIALQAMKDKGYTVEEMSKRLGKSERYAKERLLLNGLTDNFKNAFYQGKVLISHAVSISKISPAAQDRVMESEYRNWESDTFDARSVRNLKWTINRAICNLTEAPWDLEDDKLIKKKGACSTCPMNTACSGSLFPEDEKEAKCLDPECFDEKESTHMSKVIKEVIASGEFILQSRYAEDPWIKAAVKFGAQPDKILMEYTDFREDNEPSHPDEPEKPDWDEYKKELETGYYDTLGEAKEAFEEAESDYDQEMECYKGEMEEYKEELKEYNERIAAEGQTFGVWLNSSKAGRRVPIKIETKSRAKKLENVDTEEAKSELLNMEIAKLKEKEDRAKELDVAKRQRALLEVYHANLDEEIGNTPQLTDIEMRALMYLIYDNAGYQMDKFKNDIGAGGAHDYRGTKIMDKILENFTPERFAYLARRALINRYGSQHEPGNGQLAVLTMLLQQIDEKTVQEIDHELQLKIDKRIGRFNEKINELKQQRNEQKNSAKKKQSAKV